MENNDNRSVGFLPDEIRIKDLNAIQYKISLCEFGSEHNPTAMILTFSGTFVVGSLGNDDSALIRAITRAALSRVKTNALVFDLRQLSYQWDNGILDLLEEG